MSTDRERIRLQKVLASAGVGSRRVSEELIAAGRVTVDGKRATLGDRVDPETSVIHVDGERLITDVRTVHLALNKPRGVVSSMSDEKGRRSLADYVTAVPERIYHVGRLDTDSEGLLLLTNDGDLAHRLMHPSYEIEKAYRCEVRGPIPQNVAKRIAKGVTLDDGPVDVHEFRIIDEYGSRSLIEIVVHEGRKHIIRRLFDEVGHPVLRLVRTRIGAVTLGNLKPGTVRNLRREELGALYKDVGL